MTKKEEQRIKESGKVKRERGGQGSERERHSKRRKGQIFFFPRPNSHKYHPIDNNAKKSPTSLLVCSLAVLSVLHQLPEANY